MEKVKVTRDDVARLAGVAPSTVSSVVNNKPYVSDKLRDKVMQAIKELNYTPNLVARSLMTKSSKHICLILEDIVNPHFAEMAKGVQNEADLFGYILSINLATKDINHTVENYMARHVDGIIFNSFYNFISPRLVEELRESNIICVCCGGHNDSKFNFVGTDYFKGMKKAYSYLVELGHKDIAFISGLNPKEKEDTRSLAYKWCSGNLNEGVNEKYEVFGVPPYVTDNKSGYKYCMELLERKVKFSAIIVTNDFMAIGVLQCLREKGIRVPDDVSVVSFDNTVYAETSFPTLTSMAAPAFKIGQRAVRYIIDAQEGQEKPEKIRESWFDMELVVRESTNKV